MSNSNNLYYIFNLFLFAFRFLIEILPHVHDDHELASTMIHPSKWKLRKLLNSTLEIDACDILFAQYREITYWLNVRDICDFDGSVAQHDSRPPPYRQQAFTRYKINLNLYAVDWKGNYCSENIYVNQISYECSSELREACKCRESSSDACNIFFIPHLAGFNSPDPSRDNFDGGFHANPKKLKRKTIEVHYQSCVDSGGMREARKRETRRLDKSIN